MLQKHEIRVCTIKIIVKQNQENEEIVKQNQEIMKQPRGCEIKSRSF